MDAQTAEVPTKQNLPLEKPEGNAELALSELPPPHQGLHIHKATVLPDTSKCSQEKKPSKKVLVAQVKLKNAMKNKTIQKNIKNLTVYEKWVQD